MTAALATAAPLPLPAPESDWREWVTYGLSWAAASPVAEQASPAEVDDGRFMTVHAYRETTPGSRWRALFDATWPAYRSWYTRDGLAARPSLSECRDALARYMPELIPTWERLCRLSGDEPVAARMLSMWRLPAFAVGCSQAVLPGEQPTLVRNYDYDQALFEAVIASTDYSGRRRVIGTSDMLWGLLDGMNDDGLAVSLTFGGRPDVGDGFGIPIVLRYVLETCATVEQAVDALRQDPRLAVLQRRRGRPRGRPRDRLRRARATCRGERAARDHQPPTRSDRASDSRRPLQQCPTTDGIERITQRHTIEQATGVGNAGAPCPQRSVRGRLRHAVHRRIPTSRRGRHVALARDVMDARIRRPG